MPANGARSQTLPAFALRAVGLALALLFLASLTAVWASPVSAKDWTPQIQSARRGQIYWESLMRAADSDVRSLKKAQRRAERKVRSTRRNLRIVVERRAGAKKRLAGTRTDLQQSRLALAATSGEAPPPPDPEIALSLLLPAEANVQSLASTRSPLQPEMPWLGIVSVDLAAEAARRSAIGEAAALERQAKEQKRSLKKAKRKARRVARHARAANNRLANLKAAERSAIGRRESAERSLGAYVLAMAKYGRIRATKKSRLRPGVNSSFSWPARGSISQYYSGSHDGLDIVSYSGAPIRAAAYGVVTYVGWNPWDQEGRAFMVVVAHAGGYETLYGHALPRRVVRVGQEVQKGAVIAYMGNTGKSTGTHLHFELRRGRTTINPLPFL